MRTFDEAVDVAFMIKLNKKKLIMGNTADVEERIRQISDTQMAFNEDIVNNAVIMGEIVGMAKSINYTVADELEKFLATPEENADSAELHDTCVSAVASGMITALMWGVTIGRKMEEPEQGMGMSIEEIAKL